MLKQFKSELFQYKVYGADTAAVRSSICPRVPTPPPPRIFRFCLHPAYRSGTPHAVPRWMKHRATQHQAANGQRVEILTSKTWLAQPRLAECLAWLSAKPPGARAKVRHWFKYQHFDEKCCTGPGRNWIASCHRAGVGAVNQEKIAQKLHYQKNWKIFWPPSGAGMSASIKSPSPFRGGCAQTGRNCPTTHPDASHPTISDRGRGRRRRQPADQHR